MDKETLEILKRDLLKIADILYTHTNIYEDEELEEYLEEMADNLQDSLRRLKELE